MSARPLLRGRLQAVGFERRPVRDPALTPAARDMAYTRSTWNRISSVRSTRAHVGEDCLEVRAESYGEPSGWQNAMPCLPAGVSVSAPRRAARMSAVSTIWSTTPRRFEIDNWSRPFRVKRLALFSKCGVKIGSNSVAQISPARPGLSCAYR